MPVQPPAPPADHPLSHAAAEAWVPRTCFKHGPPGRIGVELEFLVVGASDDDRAALGATGVHGTVSLEPGGQLELSTHPAADLPAVLHRAYVDLQALRRAARRRGTTLLGVGLDPAGSARRVVRHPRYVAMEAFFDRVGPAGRTMMRSTASVQVNVEARDLLGDREGLLRRWETLHAVGPALVAAFANSPLAHGRPTGWRSTRQAVWWALDPYRTRRPDVRPGESLEQAWTRWCLDAPVMMVRRPSGAWHAPAGLTFRRWIDEGPRAVPDRPGPTADDLALHLTTLFPPVRARGHLEVRYVDAQPGDWWQAPVAVLAALASDEDAAAAAREACAATAESWTAAARHGTAAPELAAAARAVLGIAAHSLRRTPSTAAAAEVLEGYLDTWTARGRSPADDLLDGRPAPPCPPPPTPSSPSSPPSPSSPSSTSAAHRERVTSW